MFLSDAEQKKALKALRKRLGITGATPITGGELNALPVGTFLLKHGESLRNFVPADRPIGFLRVNEDRTGWIQSVLGSGGVYSTWGTPGGILEVVPFTPALLASMAEVPPHAEVAFIPIPHAAGYGKADTKAWVRWLGAAVLEEGSEARQALQDTIENAVGSEVKIGKIGWRPGLHRVTVQFEESGKIEPMDLDFSMNRGNPMFLSDSQKKVLKKALRRTMQEWRSAKAAAKQWGEPEPSIYDVRIPELTPKKAQIFLRHGLIEHRGYDPSHDRRAATSAFGRSYRSERVLGEPRFFWSREGLVTVKRLLEDRKSRSNPMSYKIEVRKNGQRYGEFGPYKRKSDADADAKELRRLGSGVRVSVVRSNPLTGYERTKAMLKRAAKLIDEGSLAQADSLIRESGASRVDLSNILGSKRMKKMARFARSSRSNPGHQWIQGVQEEIEEDGTAGRFTAQARRAGYKDTMAFAEKIMHEWRAGRERVWNKREKRWQKVTTMTMRRANYLLNTRQRRNG